MNIKQFVDPIYQHTYYIYLYNTNKDEQLIINLLNKECTKRGDPDRFNKLDYALTKYMGDHTYIIFKTSDLNTPNNILLFVSHESFHAATTVLLCHNIPLGIDPASQEAHAYYYEYVFINTLQAVTK